MNSGSILSRIQRPFTFAVVGDAHFTSPEFRRMPDRDVQLSGGMTARGYIENVNLVLSPMMETLASQSPAFIVMTGDLVAGGLRKALGRAELTACLRFFDAFELPLLPARGDQDESDAFADVALPYLSRRMGWERSMPYYFTDVAGCRLVVFDTGSWTPGCNQLGWFQDLMKACGGARIDRVFVFGHHPIWPVARAFYTKLDFRRDVSGVLEKCPVDAYFCGHTHNQSLVVGRTGSRLTPQMMAAPIGLADEMPTPLNRVQALLGARGEWPICWPGYLAHTAAGWFLVHVDEDSVRAEWHHLDRGAEAAVAWQRAGEIDAFWYMKHPPDARMISADLARIRRGVLRFCAWDATQPGKRVLLNGREVGELPKSNNFTPMTLELPSRALDELRIENRMEIHSPGYEASTVGNLVLEVVLRGGRVLRTGPTGELFTWSNRWNEWLTPKLRKVRRGRPIITSLSFR